MSEDTVRARNDVAKGVVLTSHRFNDGDYDAAQNDQERAAIIAARREASVNWGSGIYLREEAPEHFTPTSSGVIELGFWPAHDDELVALENRGIIPENADLAYGINFNGKGSDTLFHGIKRIDNDFVAIVSGDIIYATKVAEPGGS